MKKIVSQYTIRRCKQDNTLYGPSHGVENPVDKTLCGLEITYDWWITHFSWDGEVTCRKCLKILMRSYSEYWPAKKVIGMCTKKKEEVSK